MNPAFPYIPVLRWKGAEIAALLELTEPERACLQPLLELVPKDFAKSGPERIIALKVRQIAENWGWRHPFSIDFSLLDAPLREAAIPLFDRHAAGLLKSIITIHLGQGMEPRTLRDLDSVSKYGLGIRIATVDFRQGGWSQGLADFVIQSRLAASQIDIFIDYRAIEEEPPSYATAVAAVRAMGDWRSVTILAGAFPPDLSDLEKNDQHLLQRTDWLAWRRYTLAGGDARYGDYTIQHGVFRENEGKGFNYSASIRYTSDTDWVIMRGESVHSEMGHAQWPANAQLLCARAEFCGASFSFGDRYIKEMSTQFVHTGGAKSWLTAGISHHLAMVVHQLHNVAATPSAAESREAMAPDWPAHIGHN